MPDAQCLTQGVHQALGVRRWALQNIPAQIFVIGQFTQIAIHRLGIQYRMQAARADVFGALVDLC